MRSLPSLLPRGRGASRWRAAAAISLAVGALVVAACEVPERTFRTHGAGGTSHGTAGGGGQSACDLEEHSVEHCGACGHRCPETARDDEAATCLDGECSTRCLDGRSRCGTSGLERIECVAGVFQYAETCDFLCVEGSCDGTCRAAATGCSGRNTAVCDNKGQWEVATECPFACSEGECTGVCEPEQSRCGDSGRETCGDVGQWDAAPCGTGTECVMGACLKSIEEVCESADECASGLCTTFFEDADDDGYGSTTSAMFCGATPPDGFSANGEDCCDSDADAHPTQEDFFARERTGCGGYDFNCDDNDEPESTSVSLGCGSTGQSQAICRGWQTAAPACGQVGQLFATCTCTQANQSGCQQLCASFTSSSQNCR